MLSSGIPDVYHASQAFANTGSWKHAYDAARGMYQLYNRMPSRRPYRRRY